MNAEDVTVMPTADDAVAACGDSATDQYVDVCDGHSHAGDDVHGMS